MADINDLHPVWSLTDSDGCPTLRDIGRPSDFLLRQPGVAIMSADLLEPIQPGDLTLANRMIMAPMAPNRADENGVVPAMMVMS
jgi:NADH:flavin oxidoreductase / NADH oxidase family